MAEEEVKMEPVAGAEPPKAVNPLGAKPTGTATLKPGLRLPPKPGATVSALKPGLKLPPKPGATVSALKPGLKLPPKPGATVSALKPGLKLPPKPGATVSALKPGLKLPPKPGEAGAGLKLPPKPAATAALKPGLKLPAKPVIRKPGSTVAAAPLPKPVTPIPASASKPVEPVADLKPVEPVAELKPVEAPAPVAAPKVIPVDQQGVGKLPTVEAKAVPRVAAIPPLPEQPKPLEQLKSVTQKLKGITQAIPQQAILRKTGIIADAAMTEAQKEAAKHKTARISLSEAIGVAPVKNENAPMKTIRIKRPMDIPGATKPLAPLTRPASAAPAANSEEPETAATIPAIPSEKPAEGTAPAADTPPAATLTQRKTLKISRPGVVRPTGGKFGIKRPSQATTVVKKPADGSAAPAAPGAVPPPADGAVADIPDIPELPPATPFAAAPAAPADTTPGWLSTLSSLVQAAACVAMGLLAWYLYTNTQTMYF